MPRRPLPVSHIFLLDIVMRYDDFRFHVPDGPASSGLAVSGSLAPRTGAGLGPPAPPAPATLGGALVILALLGGYLHHPNAPPPGPPYMGRGPAPLTAPADVDERRSRMGILERRRPEPRHQKLRPDKTCD